MTTAVGGAQQLPQILSGAIFDFAVLIKEKKRMN
jgi:hypothetical protein